MRSRSALGLIELLVAISVLAIVFSVVAYFLSQQSRSTTLSQAIHDAELTARTIAESVAQDLQMAGARATFDGSVEYADIDGAADCNRSTRSGCVVPIDVETDGTIRSASNPSAPAGYTIWYRTSLAPGVKCRRVDIALIGERLYRSDVDCGSLTAIDLESSLLATNVSRYVVSFECTDGISYRSPADCYGVSPDDYVQQADIEIGISRGGRIPVESEMTLTAYTPNLRPSVEYGRTED